MPCERSERCALASIDVDVPGRTFYCRVLDRFWHALPEAAAAMSDNCGI